MNVANLERATAKLDADIAARSRVKIHDASDLLRAPLKPPNYVVRTWLCEGLTLIVGAPKVGKTRLVAQVIAAVVQGGDFWGEQADKGKVLLIDLETNARRLQTKLAQAGLAELEPGTLLYATDWPRGLLGVEAIAKQLDADPQIKLVVIDTLQRFRDSSARAQNAYAADYEALAPLQQLCRERPGVGILCVHHKRKAVADDPIDSINGSAAIAGAADAIWIMSRRGAEYSIHIEGRDWEQDENTFSIERDAGSWRLVGGPRLSASEREVLKHLDLVGGMTAPQLADALGIGRQAAYERLRRMAERGLVGHDASAWKCLS